MSESTMFHSGVNAARVSLRDGGRATSAPDGGDPEWTRGWDSVIAGPEGEAWREKVRAVRAECVEDAAMAEKRIAAIAATEAEFAEEALRLAMLANAVLDAPMTKELWEALACAAPVLQEAFRLRVAASHQLARAVLDAKVLR